MRADHDLDASGLACPLPVLKLKKAIKGMAAGETLRLVSTDAGSVADIGAFCNQTGHALLDSRRDGDAYVYLIAKA